MKTLFRLLGFGFVGFCVLVGVLLIGLVIYNIGDEKLDPEVTKLLALSPPQIPAEQNGYFTWIGVVGPETETPHSWGRRWVEQARAADTKVRGSEEEIAKLAIDDEKRQETFNAKTAPCKDANACLDEVAADPERARAVLAANAVTLARADSALDYPAYQEAWRPDFSFRSILPNRPPLWWQLSATRFALDIAEGRHAPALERLARETAFHTRQAQGAVTLIEKLLALAYLRNDYQLINRYLRAYPDEALRHTELVSTTLAPLPAGVTRLKPVLATEWRSEILLLLDIPDTALTDLADKKQKDMGPVEKWLAQAGSRLVYHRNATANAFLRRHQPLLDVDGQTGESYRTGLAAANRSLAEAGKAGIGGVPLKNPIGGILLNIAQPNFDKYFLRRDDLLMLRAAVALQFDLLRRGVTDSDAIGREIAAAGFEHPFTGQAPEWHVDTRTLVFAALPDRKNEALTIAY